MAGRPPKRAQYHCSFCGKARDQVGRLIAGPGSVYICDECIALCREIIEEESGAEGGGGAGKKKKPAARGADAASATASVPSPREIHEHLDGYVIGQDAAKKVLSVAVYNHYKRINAGLDEGVELEKSNILLVGPTGVGKTLLARTLARFLDVPFSVADATALTEAGYVGEDVENILVSLLQAADYDVPRAEKGILYLDEVDKIARKGATPSVGRDVSGEGVQQALLKILEGTTANIPPKGGRKHPEQPMIQMDTRNILFVCGGAFEGLDKVISQRVGKRTMGFGADGDDERNSDTPDVLPLVQPEDLLAYGMIPEFVGRVPVITTMDSLGADDLLRILTEPHDAIIKQSQRLFAMDGVEVEFTEESLRKIVALTVHKGTGARGLRSVLEQAMMDIMFDVPSQEGVTRLQVTGEMIESGIEQYSSEDEAMQRKRA